MTWSHRYEGMLFLSVLAACVALTLTASAPGMMLSAVLLGVGVILFGLPHGSLDVLVARRIFRLTKISAFAIFFAAYMGLSAVYGLIWWWLPTTALAAFLAISALHFSTDWERRGSLMTRLAYGLAIVTLPALGHAGEVRAIYRALGASAPDGLLLAAKIIAIPASFVALVAAYRQRRSGSRDLIEVASIILGGIVLSPILYFICYFCFLHSPRHLFTTAREEHIESLGQIVRHTFAPTLVVVAAVAAIFTRPAFLLSADRLLQVIFVGLAVLTVPHMILKVCSVLLDEAGSSHERVCGSGVPFGAISGRGRR